MLWMNRSRFASVRNPDSKRWVPVTLRILRAQRRLGCVVAAFHGLEQPAGKLPGGVPPATTHRSPTGRKECMLSQDPDGVQRLVLGLVSFHRRVEQVGVAGTTPIQGRWLPRTPLVPLKENLAFCRGGPERQYCWLPKSQIFSAGEATQRCTLEMRESLRCYRH